jgi:CBS domain containing-hemolysin-like protein
VIPVFLGMTLLLILVNALFVALEFALVGSRRTKLEAMADSGGRGASAALDASSDLTMQLAGAQLGVTMASLGIGFFGESVMSHLVESALGRVVTLPEGLSSAIGLVLGLGVVVFGHMVIGEVVPKNVSLSDPERALQLLAPVSRAYLRVFRPAVRLLQAMANAGMRLLHVEPVDELSSAHTAEELSVMLAQSHEEGLIQEFAHDLMAGVLDFGDRVASSVMVPRDQVRGLARTATVAEAEQLVVISGHSRLPVWDLIGRDGSGAGADERAPADRDGAVPLDRVIGFVHAKDLLTLPEAIRDRPLPLRLVRRLLLVNEDRPLEDVLRSMRTARTHVALVTDADGSSIGILTLEDILESLVGDILDESD